MRPCRVSRSVGFVCRGGVVALDALRGLVSADGNHDYNIAIRITRAASNDVGCDFGF